MGVGKKILSCVCLLAGLVLWDSSFMFDVNNDLLCCETVLQDTEYFSKEHLLIFMPLTINAKARN